MRSVNLMKRKREAALLAIVLTHFVACAHTAPRQDQFVNRFLQAWLAGTEDPRNFLDEHFVTLPRDDSAWPAKLLGEAPSERALRFPEVCAEGYPRCSTLQECLRDRGKGLYTIEDFTVTNEMVVEVPSIADLVGASATQVTVMLERCNLGVIVILDSEVQDIRRVRAIGFLAP